MSFAFTKRVNNISTVSVNTTKERLTAPSATTYFAPVPLSPPVNADGSAYVDSGTNQIGLFIPFNKTNDTLQYFNDTYDPNSTTFNNMFIFINGVARALIIYTIEREGTPFMYFVDNVIYRGVFTDGNVMF